VEDTPSRKLIDYVRKLTKTQSIALVDSINSRIKETGRRVPEPHELSMTALARRLYIYALKLGMDHTEAAGLPTPQYTQVKDELIEFSRELAIEGVKPPGEKDVDNFCSLKVRIRGSTRPGIYFLIALFLLKKEEEGVFADEFYQTAIPLCEMRLGSNITVFLARALNTDADAKRRARPFPNIRPPQPASDLPIVATRYLHHRFHGDQADRFFREYRSESDGNAHFIVYRSRRSKPTELIKSFLAIEPLAQSTSAKDLRYHPTLHIYQAPVDAGSTLRGSPGRIVPLESGLYIIGGQRSEPLRDGKATPLREPRPFRTIELLYFPWTTIENAHLFSGLMFAANNDGVPLVARICARPTLISRSDNLAIGEVKLSELSTSLEQDRQAEMAIATEEDPDKFLCVYDEFGSLEGLADRIAVLCNNGPFEGEWEATRDFEKDGKPVDTRAIRRAVEDAFSDITRIGDDARPFDLWQDLRFPPLTLE